MEKCYISDKDIERYLFGRLDEEEDTAFQQHLFTCEKCSAKVRNLRRLAESFHPETLKGEIEEIGEIEEPVEVVEPDEKPVRAVPSVRKLRPWLAAASVALVFAAGWIAGQYRLRDGLHIADTAVQPQIESPPEYAGGGAARKAFELVSPGEGRYVFNLNQVYADENEIMFKWTPKASNALLIIKTNDGLWDEIRVKNTGHIRVNLSDYASHGSLTWVLIIGETDEIMKGSIDLKKFIPPYRVRK